MDEAGAGDPEREEVGADLTQANRCSRLENVHILQQVRHRNERQRAHKTKACTQVNQCTRFEIESSKNANTLY